MLTDQQIQTFLKEGFTDAQIEEINIGLDNGVQVSVYARKDLMSQQMYQLRLGLQNGVSMHEYADPGYDWFQLEEIRLGLENGIDVKKYDSKELDSRKMHQMRRGLEDGMDLSDFLKYDADVMKEIRKALLSKVDILSCVEQGYEATQLREIRIAAAEGLDIFNYINPEFRSVALSEIAEGLRNGIDVEPYAKTIYSWSQMEELRLGIEAQVDITYYSSPLYDRYQMREIRLGLEDGLEVTEYSSLMYPASDMQRIRKHLLSNGGATEPGEVPEELKGQENRDGVLINISNDDMTAYICINKLAYGKITYKDIMRSLRVMGITQNIDNRLVDDFLAGKKLGEMCTIATGRPPVNGENGYFEYFFNTNVDRTPKILPDGSADFQNTEWFEAAKRGQKLAYYHSAGNGQPGATVTGKKIPAKKGRELPPLRCKGVVLQEDRKTYISDCDGRVSISGNTLEVSKILALTECNPSTGNVVFEGDINISGDVSGGVTIQAGGNITVDGFVENSNLKADGDIILRKGVNGGGLGKIVAGGSVEGKFFESVFVKAGRHISVNYCLHSNIFSEDAITIFGSKSLILGGTVFATRDIKVGNIGNELGVRSIIKMGVSDEMRAYQRKIDSHIQDLDNKLLVLEKGRRDFEQKFPAEIRNAMEMYIKIENALYTVNLEKEEALDERDKIMKQIMSSAESMLTVTGNLYDNIVIEIDGKKIISTQARNVTVKKVDNRVGIFKNTK